MTEYRSQKLGVLHSRKAHAVPPCRRMSKRIVFALFLAQANANLYGRKVGSNWTNTTQQDSLEAFGQKPASHFKTKRDYETYVAAISAIKNGDELPLRPLVQERSSGTCAASRGGCARLSSLPCTCADTVLGVELVCAIDLPYDIGPLGVDIDLVLCPRIDFSIDVLVSQFSHSLGQFGTGVPYRFHIPGIPALGTALIPGYAQVPGLPNVDAARVDLVVVADGDISSLDIAISVGACYDILGFSGCFFEIPIVQFEDWRLGPICWQPEWGPKPPSFIATGGCRNALDNVEYEPVGVTASGAPYYRESTSSYYIYWDPDCDGGSGGSARWIVDGAEPSTTAWSDLDGDGSCSYWAHRISVDSSSPPIGTASWTVYCGGSWIDDTLTLAPPPPPFVICGGCSSRGSALDNVEYLAAGFTASGAPYYRDSTSSYYVYWDHPDWCDGGIGASARWIVDGAEPSTTTAWSDLDGDSTCNYYARIDSAPTPPHHR